MASPQSQVEGSAGTPMTGAPQVRCFERPKIRLCVSILYCRNAEGGAKLRIARYQAVSAYFCPLYNKDIRSIPIYSLVCGIAKSRARVNLKLSTVRRREYRPETPSAIASM
jgi:hypothetical protein